MKSQNSPILDLAAYGKKKGPSTQKILANYCSQSNGLGLGISGGLILLKYEKNHQNIFCLKYMHKLS